MTLKSYQKEIGVLGSKDVEAFYFKKRYDFFPSRITMDSNALLLDDIMKYLMTFSF